MAILHQNDTGYLICHQKYLEETYRIPYRSIFFDLKTPFLKDLEAESIAEIKETGIEKRRRRKKSAIKKELPIEESHVNNYLTEIGQFFREPPSSNDYRQNNKPAREAVDGFLSMTSPLQNTSLTLEYSNGANDESEKIICNELCIIPPRCQFYRHNISSLDVLVNSNQKFSLIVMDPPWTNRFIKRKRKFGTNSYHSLEDNMLKTMPIGNLCQDSALVAIWCTNSSTHLDYLRNELLPAWKLTYIATWFWIKVTTSGQFVCTWNGPSGKLPFERIIFARYGDPDGQQLPFPDGKLVVSVPCAIHSFKPPLIRLLQPFVIKESKCLELFARSLLPDTVSWGDQVPLLQHKSLFQETHQIKS